MLFFCMGLGLIVSKTVSEALAFIPESVMGYAIDNNLLEAHGWSQVWFLVQKTSDNKFFNEIKSQVGQLEKDHRERIKPKSHTGTEVGGVPGNPNGKKHVPIRIPWIERKSSLLNISSCHTVEMGMSENDFRWLYCSARSQNLSYTNI
jgi:hypothetical protein